MTINYFYKNSISIKKFNVKIDGVFWLKFSGYDIAKFKYLGFE